MLCASTGESCCAVTAAPKCTTFPATCQPCSASQGESCQPQARPAELPQVGFLPSLGLHELQVCDFVAL